eukprot:GDKJ01034597.1.p1 GENE.GDKJ01034597.1~~GDKJ01034597.1.p1  ORF type:complete len:314 (-),score=47.76 GDKJ01034597.1:336-1247(-)
MGNGLSPCQICHTHTKAETKIITIETFSDSQTLINPSNIEDDYKRDWGKIRCRGNAFPVQSSNDTSIDDDLMLAPDVHHTPHNVNESSSFVIEELPIPDTSFRVIIMKPSDIESYFINSILNHHGPSNINVPKKTVPRLAKFLSVYTTISDASGALNSLLASDGSLPRDSFRFLMMDKLLDPDMVSHAFAACTKSDFLASGDSSKAPKVTLSSARRMLRSLLERRFMSPSFVLHFGLPVHSFDNVIGLDSVGWDFLFDFCLKECSFEIDRKEFETMAIKLVRVVRALVWGWLVRRGIYFDRIA